MKYSGAHENDFTALGCVQGIPLLLDPAEVLGRNILSAPAQLAVGESIIKC